MKSLFDSSALAKRYIEETGNYFLESCEELKRPLKINLVEQ